MNRRPITGAIAACVAAFALAACGTGGSGSPDRTPTVSAAPTQVTTPATTPPTTTPPTTTATPPPTTPPVTTPPPATHTAAPATHRAAAPPVTHRAVAPTPTVHRTTAAASAVCSIRSNAGNCYRAGQFCRNADLGATTTDASGRSITCVMESGRPHWHYS